MTAPELVIVILAGLVLLHGAYATGVDIGRARGVREGYTEGDRDGRVCGYERGCSDGADAFANELLAAHASHGDVLDVWPRAHRRDGRPS